MEWYKPNPPLLMPMLLAGKKLYESDAVADAVRRDGWKQKSTASDAHDAGTEVHESVRLLMLMMLSVRVVKATLCG